MKKILSALLLLVYAVPSFSMPTNDYIVPLCRQFSKDLIGPNTQPLFSPTMSVVNATTNSGFFHSAYIPAKVEKPYFRFTLNAFGGPVTNDMKTFTPIIPSKEFNLDTMLERYIIDIDLVNSKIKILNDDTAGLFNYIFLNVIDMGLKNGSIQIPSTSATMLGDSGAKLNISDTAMLNLIHQHPLYPMLEMFVPDIAKMLNTYLAQSLTFQLPSGGNLSSIFAGVPQLEIGSLYGTELLIRFIPKIDLGEYVGDFYFWGLGLKHSISQYLFEDKNRRGNTYFRENTAPIDIAVQVVYQRTSLTNTIGVTKAQLQTNANIFNINVNASKNLFNWIEVYTGISYEVLDIYGTYKYTLPVDLQRQIGLMRYDESTNSIVEDPPEYPGDHEPQIAELGLTHNQFKYTLGVAATLGPIIVFLDYSVSDFSVFGAGIQIKF